MDTCPKRLNVIAEKVRCWRWKFVVVWGEGKHSHIFILFEEKAGILKLIEWWEGAGGIFTLFEWREGGHPHNFHIVWGEGRHSHIFTLFEEKADILTLPKLGDSLVGGRRRHQEKRRSETVNKLFTTFPRRRARIGKHFTSTSESLLQVFATMFLLITQLLICKHLLFCPASLAVDMYQHTRFCFIDFFSFWT